MARVSANKTQSRVIWFMGCSDDDGGGIKSASGGDAGASGATGGMAGEGTGGSAGEGLGGSAGETGQTAFVLRIENVSDRSGLVTPFAPGVYAVHASGEPLLSSGAADRVSGRRRTPWAPAARVAHPH